LSKLALTFSQKEVSILFEAKSNSEGNISTLVEKVRAEPLTNALFHGDELD
jgi:hypothetical protein